MTTHNVFKEIQQQSSKKQTVKQKRIVDAAIRLFAEKGYSNTSTAEIAKAAEVAEASIFKHYGTKDKLLLSLIVPYIKDFFPAKADELLRQFMNDADTSFEVFLRAFLKNRAEFVLENREVFQVLVKEMIYKEELKNDLFPYLSEIVKPRLSSIIESAKEHGELIDIPTAKILHMLTTFIGGFFASRFVLLNRQTIGDDEIEEAVRFVMGGIGAHDFDRS